MRENSQVDAMITLAIARLNQSQTDDEIANAILSIDHQLSHEFKRLLHKMNIATQRLQRTNPEIDGSERQIDGLPDLNIYIFVSVEGI